MSNQQETSATGTRKDIPVSFPFKSGITFPTAFAAPVDEGIMLKHAALPLSSLSLKGVNCLCVCYSMNSCH